MTLRRVIHQANSGDDLFLRGLPTSLTETCLLSDDVYWWHPKVLLEFV